MIQGWILTRYLARQYMIWFLAFLLGLAGIIFLFEIAELLRRSTNMPDASFAIVLRMAAYKLPDTIEKILPFVVLFSGMFTFWRLTRSHELVVARAAGVSAWQFLTPALGVTFIFGWLNVMAINPIGASLAAQYKTLETRYLQKGASLELTGAGLWLRQTEGDRHYLLHADYIETDPLTLKPLIAFIYDSQNKYLGRIDAPQAVLKDGAWEISDSWFNGESDQPIHRETMVLKTSLTLEKIQESMAAPNTISFWKLPSFIDTLRQIGLPSERHEIQFHRLLAEPILLCAMILFAAAFSLRLSRQGGILNAMMLGMITGSVIFSGNNVAITLGSNGTLPVLLGAWGVPFIAIICAIATLLHREDG